MKLSPVQKKMLKLLSDGEPHSRQELHALLWDENGALSNIQTHLSIIRKLVREKGNDIVCVIGPHKTKYRLVKLLNDVS